MIVMVSEAAGELEERKKLVIFGLGNFAHLITYYIETTTNWSIACYTVDRAYVTEDSFLGKPVVAYEDVREQFPPSEYQMLVAVGYSRMGTVRKQAFERAVQDGYEMPNYVHPSVWVHAESMGMGNIILEQASISPFSTIGNANLIWNGVQLGHGDKLGSYCTLCMGSVFGGFVTIGDNCFFGLNSTVVNRVDVAPYTMLGAHSYLKRSTEENEAMLSDVSAKRHRTRDSFEMMSHWMQ